MNACPGQEKLKENMIEVIVHHQLGTDTIKALEGAFLIEVLRDYGYEIYSPCGGKGTCGKCKVWLKGEGSITACRYRLSRSVEIVLPDRKEARILVEQYAHTLAIPFDPGPSQGLSDAPHGVALDLGTTSLVFYLVDLLTGSVVETSAMLNPQARYGGDVISRINYTSEKDGGLSELQHVILDAINDQLNHFTGFAGITSNDIVKLTVSGNTTMLHLFLGIDPLPIALAPFTPGFTDEQALSGKDLDLHCHPEAEIKTLPCISAYVGADIVAGLASIKPSAKRKNYLFMDIGTNGELALVTPKGILCCSTAAGPAFEGARISCGMGGVEGAISAFDGHDLKVIGDVPPAGICGSGLIDLVAHMLEQGIVDPDGLIQEDYLVADSISITQQDIREVQLAKSAIAAGVNVLLHRAGMGFDVIDALFLAGGFGNYINPENAMKIGLISPLLAGKIIPLGNASGSGALLALKSTRFSGVIQKLLDRTSYIELSGNEEFTIEFAMNMGFADSNVGESDIKS